MVCLPKKHFFAQPIVQKRARLQAREKREKEEEKKRGKGLHFYVRYTVYVEHVYAKIFP